MTKIIGAGVAGLSFAKALGDKKVMILEETDVIGGKATTYKKSTSQGEFTFDIGGHWFHHKNYPEVLELLKGLDLEGHERKAYVYFDNVMFDFPIQQSYEMHNDQKVINKIKNELLKVEDKVPFKNYNDMLLNSYGETLYEKFFKPYNMKMYGINNLSIINVGEKEQVRNVRLDKNIKGYNSDFLYPKGDVGAIAIPMTLAEGFTIDYNAKVERINLEEKWLIANDKEMKWDKIVSTMPLKELVNSIEDVDSNIKNITNELMASKGMILNLGIKKKPQNSGISWIYVPEMEYKFYRVGFYSNIEPKLAPKGYDAVYVECSPLFFNNREEAKELVPEIINDLIHFGIIDSIDDIITKDMIYLPFNYCFPEPSKTKCIREYLRNNDIYSIGRYGSWHWSSQHEDMKQAMDLAKSWTT